MSNRKIELGENEITCLIMAANNEICRIEPSRPGQTMTSPQRTRVKNLKSAVEKLHGISSTATQKPVAVSAPVKAYSATQSCLAEPLLEINHPDDIQNLRIWDNRDAGESDVEYFNRLAREQGVAI
jgi:hypothetical protein